MKIVIASDHRGVDLKEAIKKAFSSPYEFIDLGTSNEEAVDYPDFAFQAAELVSRGEVERGILICGTGIGMSIVANKFPRVRAALVGDLLSAELSRKHNDANVLTLGSLIHDKKKILAIVRIWLTTSFEGGRHQRRIDKILAIERKKKC